MPLLETLSTSFRKARSVNQTSNGYVAKIPTITEPTGDAGTATGAAVIDLNKGGLYAQNRALIVPYGTGSDDGTFSVRLVGWRFLPGTTANPTGLWIPVNLGEFACTLSTVVGVAGMALVATERLVDIITATKQPSSTDTDSGGAASSGQVQLMSPANDTVGYLILELRGFQKLELSFTTGGSATDCNALLALL